MIQEKIIPVIICGGTGTRLWPLSRESFPKQYLSVIQDSKYSLFQNTLKRLEGLNNFESPIIICNEEHRFIVAEQLRQININEAEIFLEPCGRNTAPAIAIAALNDLSKDKNSFLLVLAADHVIRDEIKFKKAINLGAKYAENERLITFGIVPTSPETGFGYIEANEKFHLSNLKPIKIKKFIEKPNKEKAEKLIKDKYSFWNSGMFLFKSNVILKELQILQPDIINICKKALSKIKFDLDFKRIDKEIFQQCPNLSIDVAVMEKTELGMVIPLDVGWNDIGSWKSLWAYEDKDKDKNVLVGDVLLKHSKNSYIRSEDKLVVAVGIKDLVIVETKDSVLVLNNKYDQEIKGVVQDLERIGYEEAKVHKKVYRPWGNYTSLAESSNWKVKRIEVNVGASLSLQFHKHRSEHWVVVKGIALVQIENNKSTLKANQSVYIPCYSKHRLSNKGKEPLILIEVQSGDYLGEDDIVRFQDIYGRN